MSTSYDQLGYVRVSACSPPLTINNPQANAQSVLDCATDLHRQSVTVAVAPELCLTGYTAEDLLLTNQLIDDCEQALALIAAHNPLPILAVGTPWRLQDGRLLNCAAVFGGPRLLGIVPKSRLPNYGEFYEQRWFVSGINVNEVCQHPVLGEFPIRVDQLFAVQSTAPGTPVSTPILVGAEICEDLWAPTAPSTAGCLAGADIFLNLSASNELIAKSSYRKQLVSMASAKNICAYAYSSSGPMESTKDVVFGGHCFVFEDGVQMAENERFEFEPAPAFADIDLLKLRQDRATNTTFAQTDRLTPYRITHSDLPVQPIAALKRQIDRHPFVPDDEGEFSARAAEIMAIQATGLARRFKAAHSDNLVIGLSGGLDSTLAYLVCLDTLAKLKLPNKHLHVLTMPGPGTTSKTYGNVQKLTRSNGVLLEEIPIEAAVEQHLQDLKHAGEHDVVFENAQARERTQLLFNYANKVNGIVVGTGDLSELALGWCTFNADQIASYNVNAGVPKTMMAYLVRWYASHRAEGDLAEVLEDVLDTPISPELLPHADDEIEQVTEDIVGPYELHDFFLYHYVRNGARPAKIQALAELAFADSYSPTIINRWLGTFFRRFFTQQFKRTTLPPGPKIGSVSLSPRGDWRMPDEASAEQILKEVAEVLETSTAS